jgi:hypothetical protein
MLKISVIDTARECLVIAEGKLIAPWAAELRNVCHQATADLRGRALIVEMKHITRISQEGENVVVDLINSGIEVHASGVFTDHVMKQLTRRANRNLGRQTGD